MDAVELLIVSAISAVLILWFGVYLWRQIRYSSRGKRQ
jgi:hypothetical protein